MANYYALIAKAVTGLNAQERRTLYERGGGALLAELRAVIPPLGELVITREQLASRKRSSRSRPMRWVAPKRLDRALR